MNLRLIAFYFFMGLMGLSIHGWSVTTAEAEGLYEVSIICEDRSNPACNELNRKARLSIIRTDEVLAVSIGYPEVSIPRYAFISTNTELSDSRYVGDQMVTSSASAQFAEVVMTFNNDENGNQKKTTINGIIRDARFLKDVTFSGHQTLSLNNLKTLEPSADGSEAVAKTEGRFLAKGKYRQWIITIRKTLSNSNESVFLAETTDMGSPDGSELASGERRYLRSIKSQHQDTLEFVAALHEPGSFLKWVIWSSPERVLTGKKLEGFFYSSTGVFSHLTLEAI